MCGKHNQRQQEHGQMQHWPRKGASRAKKQAKNWQLATKRMEFQFKCKCTCKPIKSNLEVEETSLLFRVCASVFVDVFVGYAGMALF